MSDFSPSSHELHLSEEPVDVELRRMIVKYFNRHLFVFVGASVDGSKAAASCCQNEKKNASLDVYLHYQETRKKKKKKSGG